MSDGHDDGTAREDGRDPAASAPDAPPPAERPAADGYPPLADHLQRARDGFASADRDRSRNKLVLLLLFGALPMIVVFVAVLGSLASGPPDDNGGSERLSEVTRYCVYVAKDTDDNADCLDRTDPRIVEREDSNAGRYARGELLRCLDDSGPLCRLK